MRYFLDLKEDVNIKAIQAIHIFNFFLTPTIMHNERSLLLAETGNHSPGPDFASQQSGAVTSLLGIVVVLLAIFFSTCATYDGYNSEEKYSPAEYAIFRDIMVMLILGFGYLMTFLGRYGLGSVGFTLMLTALAIPLNMAVEHYVRLFSGRAEEGEGLLTIDMGNIIDGEFFAATVLISFGAIIGRASPLQLVIMVLGQSVFYTVNKVVLVLGNLKTEDVGGTMTIHMFGAYFGLAVSKLLGPEKASSASKADATAVSDVLSLIGTTLLWVYWPSFVGATETASPDNERLCVLQTILALLGSTLATFVVSPKLCHGKLDPVHIANSTLAGGVAVGSSARLVLYPVGAFVLGLAAGTISVIGYVYISPMLQKMVGVYDTCGVGNLHGLPSLLGGLASALFVVWDSENINLPSDGGSQMTRQLAGVAVTFTHSIVSGGIIGAVMNMARPVSQSNSPDDYDDGVWWEGDYFQ